MNRPAEVLDAAFAALNLDDWARFTELCDPVSLRAFNSETLEYYADGPDVAHVLYRDDQTVDRIFPEEYAELMSGKPADEQQLARQLHHHSHPQFATCRRQPDGTWRLIAERYLMLVSSLQRV